MGLIDVLKDITIRKNLLLKLIINKKDTYLYKTGWIRSYRMKQPVNLVGEPQPWLALSCNFFLERRLKNSFDLLEYGSGNSSLYFSKKCRTVTSIESDQAWYNHVKNNSPANVNLIYSEALTYHQKANDLHQTYDIILIDGINREACFDASIGLLKSGGIVILDDSDRPEYASIMEKAKNMDFKSIAFFGLALGSFRMKTTTIFYKANNCLDI